MDDEEMKGRMNEFRTKSFKNYFALCYHHFQSKQLQMKLFFDNLT